MATARAWRGVAGLMLAGASAALAPAGAAASDAQLWAAVSTSMPLAGPLELHADMNARWFDNASNYGHFQVRGMLGWRVRPQLLLGGGYSYVRSELPSGRTVHEHRLFQQLNMQFAELGRARLTGRTRFEQRSIREADGVALRLRQQVALSIPLEGPPGLRAILNTEPFFLLNAPDGTSPPTGLNQVRSFAGLGIPIAKGVALEAGYMNQFILAGDDRANHILNIGLTTRF